MQCLCRRRLVSALPYRRTKRGPGKGNAPLTHISTLSKEKMEVMPVKRKAKGEETVVLSSSEFLGEIKAYLLGLTRADCCVTVRGEATLCNCLTFLSDKPSVIKYVASSIQMYFNFDDRNRRYHLVSEMRYVVPSWLGAVGLETVRISGDPAPLLAGCLSGS